MYNILIYKGCSKWSKNNFVITRESILLLLFLILINQSFYKNYETVLQFALKCANNSQFQIFWKTRFGVKIEKESECEMQEQFGFRLVRVMEEATQAYLCNIEAKFGRITNDDKKLQLALTVLKPRKGNGLKIIIIQNKFTFMADNVDIQWIIISR